MKPWMTRTESKASAAVRHMRWPSVKRWALSVDRATPGADVKERVDMSASPEVARDQSADAARV